MDDQERCRKLHEQAEAQAKKHEKEINWCLGAGVALCFVAGLAFPPFEVVTLVLVIYWVYRNLNGFS